MILEITNIFIYFLSLSLIKDDSHISDLAVVTTYMIGQQQKHGNVTYTMICVREYIQSIHICLILFCLL